MSLRADRSRRSSSLGRNLVSRRRLAALERNVSLVIPDSTWLTLLRLIRRPTSCIGPLPSLIPCRWPSVAAPVGALVQNSADSSRRWLTLSCLRRSSPEIAVTRKRKKARRPGSRKSWLLLRRTGDPDREPLSCGLGVEGGGGDNPTLDPPDHSIVIRSRCCATSTYGIHRPKLAF